MSRMLDILEDYVNLREFEYCRIDGSTKGEERNEQIDEFNSKDSNKFVFLLTTRAGGLGINLYTADSVIIYDSDWNPYADIQAQDRAHRIGQTKQVQIFRMVTENTIEESIVLRAQQKLKLDDVLIRKDERRRSSTLNNQELMHILAQGLDAIESQNSQNPLSFEEILKIGKEKTREMEKKIENFKIGDEEGKKINVFNWEGENYYRKKLDRFIVDNPENPLQPIAKRLSVFKTANYKPLNFPGYQFYPKEFFDLQNREEELYEKGEKLSDEEKVRKEELLQHGFDWTKKDYKAFLNAIETAGKNKEAVCQIMSYKKDVEKYFDVFFERYEELENAEKIGAIVERSESKVKANKRFKTIMQTYEDIEIEKAITSKNRFYTDNLDLLKIYSKYIDDKCPIESVKAEIMISDKYSFDYYIRTRTVIDLAKHLNTLITQLLRNFDKIEVLNGTN
ncbi:hypothetical protein NUSPORA_01090 [Nucleospora cyclopteri]